MKWQHLLTFVSLADKLLNLATGDCCVLKLPLLCLKFGVNYIILHAHCENHANNGHVTTLCNLIGRSYALPGDKQKCLHSPDPFSLLALGGTVLRDYLYSMINTLNN